MNNYTLKKWIYQHFDKKVIKMQYFWFVRGQINIIHEKVPENPEGNKV